MTLYKWSQTASSDATADSTINWAEGQAPSSVNDSARAMMAATAKYRDDIAGAIVTVGHVHGYTVSSYQVFDTLAHLDGQMIAFTPHATNGATVTLNVDWLGAKPLRTAPGVELLAGTIIQGTPYVAVYNNGDGAFYLQGFYGNPYNVPLGAGMDYWLTDRAEQFVRVSRRAGDFTDDLFGAVLRSGTTYGRRRIDHVQSSGQDRPCLRCQGRHGRVVSISHHQCRSRLRRRYVRRSRRLAESRVDAR